MLSFPHDYLLHGHTASELTPTFILKIIIITSLLESIKDSLRSSCKKHNSQFTAVLKTESSPALICLLSFPNSCWVRFVGVKSVTVSLSATQDERVTRNCISSCIPVRGVFLPSSCRSSVCWCRLSRSWWRRRCPGDGWRWRNWRRCPLLSLWRRKYR